MLYNQFQDKALSALGMGTMRLPTKDGKIDYEATKAMIAFAMAHGINYYDTAWGYHGGQSETVIGELLSAYPRESYYLATKFPGYDLSNMPKVKEIFERQLEKCRVGYVDFYLLHNVCEANIDAYLDPKFGIMDYLTEQKRAGRIRHLGFSCHATVPTLRRLLEAYGKELEFAQLELNWLDWTFQDGEEKAALCREYGLPIIVMEPLRGGRLANLSEEETAALRALRPEETVPGWAFRFLQSVPGIAVTLSGMSNMEQLAANIATFETNASVNAEERQVLIDMGRAIPSTVTVPCTACRYCVDHCPQGLDIPRLLKIINEHNFTKVAFRTGMGLKAIDPSKHPDQCLGCGSCEAVCPQNIKISDTLAAFVQSYT